MPRASLVTPEPPERALILVNGESWPAQRLFEPLIADRRAWPSEARQAAASILERLRRRQQHFERPGAPLSGCAGLRVTCLCDIHQGFSGGGGEGCLPFPSGWRTGWQPGT
ncbi:hypothetical protein NDU88_006026 [Pleurodeles waltl]|uniref:Uncharacterized protein n=1 Tax=Pleurodeles waltl TaxID=8319 RepID=A0AAV7QIX1_PLEWA|nr:hypothetical protein NDU88_006026 [Pleurodeles waltl]